MSQLYKWTQDPTKSLLLIGTDEESAEIQAELKGQGMAPQIRSILPDNMTESLQEIENVAAVCCIPGSLHKTYLLALHQFCQEKKVDLFFCTPGLSALQKNMQVKNIGFMSFLSPLDEPLSHWWNRWVKRLFDLLISGFFLFFVFPFIYIVATVIIKHKSPGPVFSLAKERNRKGKIFDRLTFRTEDLSASSFFQKPRIKELPQLLNVFKGNISIVPDIVKCQLCKNADVWYTQNWSLWLDIKILIKAMFKKNEQK